MVGKVLWDDVAMVTSNRRTALVLGASSDLGAEVARRLAGLMSTLLVHGANPDDLPRLSEEVAQREGHCRVIPLSADFASLAATRTFVRRCAQAVDRLDVVVNAVERLPPPSLVVTTDGHELTWQVNHLGPAAVVLGLLALLRDSPDGRIVQVIRDPLRAGVPSGETTDYQPAAAYVRAKQALMMFSKDLADRLRGTPCRAVSMQPVGVDIGAAPAPLSRGLMVDAVLYACTSPEVPNGAHLRGRRAHPLPRAAASAPAQRRLWRITCEALNLPAEPFPGPISGPGTDR